MTEEDLRILRGQAVEAAQDLGPISRGELIDAAKEDISELMALMWQKNHGYGTDGKKARWVA